MTFELESAFRCAAYCELSYFGAEHISELKPEAGIRLISNGETQAYVIFEKNQNTIVFRGTEFSNFMDLIRNVQVRTVPYGNSRMHRGYLAAFKRVKHDIVAVVRTMDVNKPLFITGHSLGGCLASIASLMIERPFECYTFGMPKLGYGSLAKQLNMYRLVYKYDIVPHYPISLFYRHGGSPYRLTDNSLTSGINYEPIMNFQDHGIDNYVVALQNEIYRVEDLLDV